MSAVSRLSGATIHVRRPGWGVAFAGLLAVSVATFFIAPWSIEAKSIAILHGLCAQRPSHSFWFGSDRLPFGSRMTGIYGGFLITQLYLLGRGRFRTGGVPSLTILTVLSLFIVAMGIDGINSTLDDVQLLTIYHPNNVLRFVTGALTGTTLAVFLWLLTINILWHVDKQSPKKVMDGVGDLASVAVPIALFGVLATSGWLPAYAIIAIFLMFSAVLVIFELAICLLLLVRRRESSARSMRDLSSSAFGALVAAYLFIFIMAGLRFLMEATTHVKPLN